MLRRLFFLGLAAVALAGCLGDVSRSNPLDPLSGDFDDAGALAGVVTGLSALDPVAGALVRVEPLSDGGEPTGQPDLATRTGSDGRFALDPIASGRYRVVAEADGYLSAADTVTVAVGARAEVTLRLDGQPVLTVQAVRTEHVSRWWPSDDLYRLIVEATATDPDGPGDLAHVRLSIPSLGVEDSLSAVPGEGDLYAGAFTPEALGLSSLFDLLGRPLRLVALDRAGAASAPADVFAVRIIEPTPLALTPRAGEPVNTTPLLQWEPLSLPFAFTWRIQLVLVTPDVEAVVGTFENVPSTQTTLQVPPGVLEINREYYWTVAAVDGFGNLSRSKQAGFVVVEVL